MLLMKKVLMRLFVFLRMLMHYCLIVVTPKPVLKPWVVPVMYIIGISAGRSLKQLIFLYFSRVGYMQIMLGRLLRPSGRLRLIFAAAYELKDGLILVNLKLLLKRCIPFRLYKKAHLFLPPDNYRDKIFKVNGKINRI